MIESQCLGTPVIGSRQGGIPELIEVGKTGELFEAGNVEQLEELIYRMWNDIVRYQENSRNCGNNKIMTLEEYCEQLISIY